MEQITFWGILGALTAVVVRLQVNKHNPAKILHLIFRFFLVISVFALLYIFLNRSIRLNFPALTNLYEALIFFSLCLLTVVIVLEFRETSGEVLTGGLLIILLLLVLASSPLIPDDLLPPIPVLRSSWLVLHVALAFLGESLFAAAFIAAIIWFTTTDKIRQNRLEKLVYRSISIGYPLYTLGALVFGAVWAHYAWGRFWSWDPKETWALITWLTYTYYLHSRLTAKHSPRKTHLIAIFGFIFTLITFLGIKLVSFGSESLHVY